MVSDSAVQTPSRQTKAGDGEVPEQEVGGVGGGLGDGEGGGGVGRAVPLT